MPSVGPMNPAPAARPTHVPRRHTTATVVLVRGGAELASWPLMACGAVDLAVVDELARVQLAARRMGCSIRLRDACKELVELLDFVGLRSPLGPLQVLRQAEGGEEVGVEEVVVTDDPVA